MTDPDPRSLEHVDQMGRAAGVSALGEFAAVPAFEPVDRRSSRGSLLFAAAAVVVVLALGAAAIAVLGNGDDGVPVATDDGAGSVLPPLAPTYLPDGYELFEVTPPGHDEFDRFEAYGLVRSEVDDPFEDELVQVQVVPADEPLQGDDEQRVTLGPDLEGVAWEGSGGRQLMWVEDGRMITLATYDLGVEDLTDLARDMSGHEIGVPPDGWRSIPSDDSEAGLLHYVDGDGGILLVGLSPELDLLSFLIAWERSECERISAPCPEVTASEVRGEEAQLIDQVDQAPHLALAWTDRTGWSVVVEGDLPEDELLRIAESLEPTTWDELRALFGGAP
ncbi:MAG: hypothetical protein U5K29_12575 [Acidimicrobiales bacterium]|nr:hypothetical protein [Acidimicrobiales bacterium]